MNQELKNKITLKLGEALDQIAKTVGDQMQEVSEYYASFSPNKWQEAYDRIDRFLLETNFRLVWNQVTIFESTILTLYSDYSRIKKGMRMEQINQDSEKSFSG